MRTQRHPWMVEGLKQYELVYDIVIHLVQEMIEFQSLQQIFQDNFDSLSKDDNLC